MRQGRLKRWTALAAGLVISVSACWGLSDSATGADAAGRSRRFELTLESTLKIQRAGADVRLIETWNRLLYDRTRREAAVDVALHSLEMVLKEDGRDVFSTRLGRDGIATTRGDITKEEGAKDAGPSVRRILESFDTTAMTVLLDSSGKERKRTPKITGPMAAPVLGSLDLLLALHPQFPADADRWGIPVKIALEQGRFAEGTLTFEKLASSPSAVRVMVSGRLKPVANGSANGESRTGTYAISGEQVYDPQAREWRSAQWSMEMAFDILQNGKPAGGASGTIKLTMTPAAPDAESVTTEKAPRRKRR